MQATNYYPSINSKSDCNIDAQKPTKLMSDANHWHEINSFPTKPTNIHTNKRKASPEGAIPFYIFTS